VDICGDSVGIQLSTCVLCACIVSIWVVEGLGVVPVLYVVVRGGLDRVSRCKLLCDVLVDGWWWCSAYQNSKWPLKPASCDEFVPFQFDYFLL
jgi:hypothetical protein